MSRKRGKLSLPDAAPASYCHAEQGYLLARSLTQSRAYLARLIGGMAHGLIMAEAVGQLRIVA